MEYILLLTIHADPAMPPGYSEWGGTHTYMRELLDTFGKLHIKCVLITRRTMKELPPIEHYNEYCDIYRLKNGDIAPMDKTKLHEYHEANLLAIQQIIRDIGEPPKVIHSVYWNSGRIGVELSKLYKVPLVHSVISNSRGRQIRGAYEPLPQRADYEQIVYNHATWILCVSEDEKNDLEKYYNVSPEKLIVAGQYIDFSFVLPSRDDNGFPRLNSRMEVSSQYSAAINYNNVFKSVPTNSFWIHKAFTYFGRIDENKGVDHILSAWCSLYKKYDALCPPLWLIGGSVEEINLMRTKQKKILPYLEKAEAENKIVWWGCIDSIGASTLLLKTLVLVTNSLYEPGGRVVTEAMSEGVPVIAAPNGFALDLIVDWKNGFLVNHGDERGLMIRMEHFIRQPFLSNVLGENARQTAQKTICEWDFTGKHLKAYGFNYTSVQMEDKDYKNYFSRREITLFPYRNLPLSSDLLCKFIEKHTGEKAISVSHLCDALGTSDIYYIQGEQNNYIIKHPYSRLALSPLILPIQRTEYVRSAWDFYKYEVDAYKTCKSDILIASDDSHQLLLLRELKPYMPSTIEYSKIINFLSNQPLSLPEKDVRLYNDTLSTLNIDTVYDIESFLKNLMNYFPDFYFDPSATFHPYIGWKLAPYILDYNSAIFNEKQLAFLHTICDYFSNNVKLFYDSNWYEITADISLQHIMLDNQKIVLIDRERRTIGHAEDMIADFLLDILTEHLKDSANTLDSLLTNYIPSNCNKKLIIDSLSYKLFYRTILESVMQKEAILPYMEALETLLYREKL